MLLRSQVHGFNPQVMQKLLKVDYRFWLSLDEAIIISSVKFTYDTANQETGLDELKMSIWIWLTLPTPKENCRDAYLMIFYGI